jgi:hypothetical protein
VTRAGLETRHSLASEPPGLYGSPVTRNQKALGILGLASVIRIGFAVLALVALGVGYDRDLHIGDAINFFFYFTDLSNLFGAGVLLYGGVAAWRGRPDVPDLVRGAAALYLVITGLVYWTLLASQMTAATIKWENDIVHGVMPAVLVLDWLLMPPAARLSLAKATQWLAFPLLYLAVSLVRGPIVHWWPYGFLDPRKPGGYLHVTTWSLIVTAVFVLFMTLIVAAGNQLGGRRSSAAVSAAGSDSSLGSPSADRTLSSRSA